MKTIKLLFIGIMAAMTVSCGGKDLFFDGFHVDMNVILSFQDSEGNDLVKAIETAKPEFMDITELVVAPDLYSLVSSPNRWDMGLYSGGAVLWDNYYLHPFLEFYAPYNADDHFRLGIVMPCLPDREQQTVTYTLTCPQLFGDELAHEIVTYWSKDPNSIPFHSMLCEKVVVDGREFTAGRRPDLEWATSSYATIVLDR